MFVWKTGFQNPLAHTHFNMFVDEWTSANESPDLSSESEEKIKEKQGCHASGKNKNFLQVRELSSGNFGYLTQVRELSENIFITISFF